MNYLPLLVKLSESEKRFLIFLFFLLIVVLALFGIIYEALNRFMTREGRDIGRLMATQINSGYISSLQQFKRNSYRKSRIEFYKQFSKTFLAMVVWFAVYGTVSIFYRHWLNIFDQAEEGIMTIVYTFDFANAPRATFFGLTLISDWPAVLHSPVFKASAIPSYILFPLAVIIIIVFLLQIFAYLSRTIYIMQHSNKLFSLDLSEIRLDDIGAAPATLQEKGVNTPEVRVATAPPSEVK